MGYKYILPPITLLPYPVGRGNLIPVSAELFNYAQVNLPDDKWTYLELSYDALTEVVRVEGITTPNFLVVSRGRDGTKPLAFPQGATVRYVPTAEAVRDAVIPNLLINPAGAITYHNNVFDVPLVAIICVNGARNKGVFSFVRYYYTT